MPQIAQAALEAGLDGKATRRLAVLEHPTYFEVVEVLPRVREELGLAQIPIGLAAVRVAKQIAREILDSGDDPLRHIRDFESLWVRSDYAHEISDLGTLYDDVWIDGRPEPEIREWVMSTLKNFVQRQSTS